MIALHILFFFLSHLHYKLKGQTSIHKSDASILIWRAFPIPLVLPEELLLLFCQNTLYGEHSEVIQSLAFPLSRVFSETALI